MTPRERMTMALTHREADRVPITDSPWDHTIARWHEEGLPKDQSPADYSYNGPFYVDDCTW